MAGTVLPGLINAHVHLVWDAGFGMLDRYRAADDAELLLGIAGRAQQALRAGVTTLRDLGDRDGLVLRVRDAITRGDLTGPRLLGSGPPLTPPNGHCHFFGGAVSGPDQIRDRIRGNAALGADVIKVMASGGEMTPTRPPPGKTSFRLRTWSSSSSRPVRPDCRWPRTRTRTEPTRDAGSPRPNRPAHAHAHGTDAIAAAVTAGVDTIEHCSWQGADNSGPDLRDDTAREIAARGIAVCHAYPPDWKTFQQFVGEHRAQAALDRLHWMDQQNIRFLPGTDGGLPTSVFDNYAGALTYYTDALGWPPERVIDMATTTQPARSAWTASVSSRPAAPPTSSSSTATRFPTSPRSASSGSYSPKAVPSPLIPPSDGADTTDRRGWGARATGPAGQDFQTDMTLPGSRRGTPPARGAATTPAVPRPARACGTG